MTSVQLAAFTREGCALAKRLADALAAELQASAAVSGPARLAAELDVEACASIGEWAERAFRDADALVFVGAAGIAVRAIAPHVRDKFADPAVVCVDEQGRVAVPLLSGHVGGANDLARSVARITGGVAAVSTATDLNGAFAIDEFARDNDLALSNRQLAKRISAALLDGWEVTFGNVRAVLADANVPGASREEAPGEGVAPDAVADAAAMAPAAATSADGSCEGAPDLLRLVPRDVVVGVGCRRGAPREALEDAIDGALERAGVDPLAVAGLATIDVKSDEPGLARLARERSWQLRFHSAGELAQVPGDFEESDFVREAVGVGNVCERAALLSAGPGAAIIAPKEAHDGVTVALARKHACRLYVVGIGPGSAADMTPRARRAIEASHLVVGYTAYVKLLEGSFPHKQMRATGMRAEVERCRLALEEASRGRTVALVCSGDAGVYGMAGPCLELAPEFPQVEIEVVPGVTAASSGAALLGAPLGHDFAVVSLSDLLTPWEAIAARLDAAARAGLCLCLYNPASRKRPDHLRRACDILLESLDPRTVCGIARNIGREGEACEVLALAELRTARVDMFCTVFVGNARTRVVDGRMVTPRGYRLSTCPAEGGEGAAVPSDPARPGRAEGAPCSDSPRSLRSLRNCARDPLRPPEAAVPHVVPSPGAAVLVFGGTVEGRELVEWLAGRGCPVVVSCATDYGASLVRGDGVTSLVGRLDEQGMGALMRSRAFDCVVDATHPYALQASANIAAAARDAGLPCIRLARPDVEFEGEGIVTCADAAQAAQVAAAAPGNVLLTTGTKDLAAFVKAMPDFAERLYARILPVRESIDIACGLGLPASHIVAMQGPFSPELNSALMRSLDISLLVTKASGRAGGFPQKLQAARACSVDVVVIGRPDEAGGCSMPEVKRALEERMGL